MIGHTKHESGPEPDREYRELNSSRDADQVAAPRIVGNRKPRRDPNHRRDSEAAHGFLKPVKSIGPP